jgi:hypothetical protein
LKIYIFGYKGNMARRYRAILRHLGHKAGGEDTDGVHEFTQREADAIIVATPTATHCEILHDLRDSGLPILCEKPITKSMTQLETLLDDLKKAGTKLEMVSQYDYLVDPCAVGDTSYDYYRSGGDGLAWDCINIIKHAKGTVTLAAESPVWRCTINGQVLSLRDMDHAYVEMMDHWLRDPTRTDFDKIYAAHKKAHDMEAKCRAS